MKLYLALSLIALTFAAENPSNILLQKPDQQRFEEIFSPLMKGSRAGEFGFDLFSQLKEKVEAGGDISDIHDHIVVLKNHLETAYNKDQDVDNDFYKTEDQKINQEIDHLNNEIGQLQEEQAFLEEKLSVLNSQSNIIDSLFASDSEAYAARVGTQNAMLDTLQLLITKINDHLIDGESFIQKKDLFDELKKIGRGKHVEVLAQIYQFAQLTAHLDHDQVQKILQLFQQLSTAIKESLAADEVKEEENVRLHNSLREEIGRLIPDTNTKLGNVLDEIEDRQIQKSQLQTRHQELTMAYQERSDHRKSAIGKTTEAKQLLDDNIQRLTRWEQLVDQGHKD